MESTMQPWQYSSGGWRGVEADNSTVITIAVRAGEMARGGYGAGLRYSLMRRLARRENVNDVVWRAGTLRR